MVMVMRKMFLSTVIATDPRIGGNRVVAAAAANRFPVAHDNDTTTAAAARSTAAGMDQCTRVIVIVVAMHKVTAGINGTAVRAVIPATVCTRIGAARVTPGVTAADTHVHGTGRAMAIVVLVVYVMMVLKLVLM